VVRAILQGHIIAESDDTEVADGNHYFPPDSIHPGALLDSPTTTRCHWKGTANYRYLLIDGEVVEDAAWTYLDPSRRARHITGYVAFSPGVQIEG
jgi:uncharacterized protein (DUF427 family)